MSLKSVNAENVVLVVELRLHLLESGGHNHSLFNFEIAAALDVIIFLLGLNFHVHEFENTF